MSDKNRESIEVFGIPVGVFQENTFFLRRADRAETVIIDPGGEGGKLSALVRSHRWKPVAIVNTHGHIDHVGAVQPLKEEYRIPFYLHPDDEPILAASPEHARFYGVPEPAVPEIDRELVDGETLEMAGMKLRIIHTPGHTPGGVSIVTGDRVFAGDTLFLGSIGRTDLPGGDRERLIRSIRERLFALPGETIVHCGHGPDTTIGHEMKSNPFLIHPS